MLIHTAATSIIRRESDPVWRPTAAGVMAAALSATPALSGVVEAVTKAADSGDDVGTQLLVDAGHENLDGIGIAVEILIVDMLDQLRPADHLALVVEEVR